MDPWWDLGRCAIPACYTVWNMGTRSGFVSAGVERSEKNKKSSSSTKTVYLTRLRFPIFLQHLEFPLPPAWEASNTGFFFRALFLRPGPGNFNPSSSSTPTWICLKNTAGWSKKLYNSYHASRSLNVSFNSTQNAPYTTDRPVAGRS